MITIIELKTVLKSLNEYFNFNNAVLAFNKIYDKLVEIEKRLDRLEHRE